MGGQPWGGQAGAAGGCRPDRDSDLVVDYAAAEWTADDAARRASGMSDLAALVQVAKVAFPVGGRVNDVPALPAWVERCLLTSAALLDAV